MQVITSRGHPNLEALLDIMRQVSSAEDPQKSSAAFLSGLWRIRSVDYFISLSVRGVDEGRYRISRRHRIAEVLSGALNPADVDPWRVAHLAPTYSGGFLGDMIETPLPKLVWDLDLRDDPVLGGELSDMRSAVAIPLFDGGRALNWGIQFRKEPRGYTLEDMEQMILTGNLFGSMTRNLVSLREVKVLHARLQSQMEEVARLQQSLLPKVLPQIPGVALATSYLTSDDAGGDYYDFFQLPDGTWGILIADVSGHGAGAATVMAMLHAILHSYPDLGAGPASVLAHANDRLVQSRIDGNFVTAIFMTYDPVTRELRYSRAGHPPPRVKDTRTGELVTLEDAASLPLGIVSPYEVGVGRVRLEPGHSLILFTDGITEAFDAEGRMFGTQGMDAALAACSGKPDCVVESIHAALYEHTRSRKLRDDQTLVVMHVLPEGAQAAMTGGASRGAAAGVGL